MNRRRLITVAAIIAGCVACDQTTKIVAAQVLGGGRTASYLGGFVRLGYVENPGAFLSLGESLPAAVKLWLFTAAVGVVIVGAAWFATSAARTNAMEAVALALFAGGGIGNLIDRIANDGRVVDFMILGLGPVHTGVFNVADIAITAAPFVLVLGWWRQRGARG